MAETEPPDDLSARTPIVPAQECPRHPHFYIAGGECPECARERDDLEAERYAVSQRASQAHYQKLARVWAPVVAVLIICFFGMFAAISYFITSEHADEHRHQISVWCYADPNTQDATSQATGSPADLARFCPDNR